MKKLIMIGNSHIDPVWLWRDSEGFQAMRATFSSALQRMDEFPEFEYTASTSAFIPWLRMNCPDMLESIAQRVKEGRWHWAGGWWVEPDCNIPGGESLVRQGLYGQRELLNTFGVTAEGGYNVDSFGHQAGLPSILAGQRLHSYVFMRPQEGQVELESPVFVWEGEDGKRVTGARTCGEYCAWTRTAIVDNMGKTLAAMDKNGLECMPVYYGVGNHGGGPTIENIKSIRELRLENPELDLVNGGPDDFFGCINTANLPVVKDELEGCFPGCFTVEAELKGLVRRAEHELTRAEALSVISGTENEFHARLTEAWKLLLFCQFHDTLAGTARADARSDAVQDVGRVLSVARNVCGSCLQRISNRFDTRGDGFPLIVVNPTGYEFNGLVETDVEWRSKFPMRLKDQFGHEQPYDASVIMLTAPDTRKHFVFRAQLPPFGIAVFRLMPEAGTLKPQKPERDENVLENEFIRVVISPVTGMPESITDRQSGREILASPACLSVYEDARDTWGAAGTIGNLRGRYAAVKLYREEDGILRSTLTARLEFGRSTALARWSLAECDHALKLSLTVDSHEKLAITGLTLPLKNVYDTACAEAAYAEAVRPYSAQGEHNMQRYLYLNGANGRLLIANNAVFCYRTTGDALELMLLRGAVHAFGSGETIQDDREYCYADQGRHHFELALYPSETELTRFERARDATFLHIQPDTLLAEQHTGPEPRRGICDIALVGLDSCAVTCIKRGEDGGVCVRLYSYADTDQTGILSFRGRQYEANVQAHSLSTLVLHGETARMTDLLELNDNI